MKKMIYLFLFLITTSCLYSQDFSYLKQFAGERSSQKVWNDSIVNPIIRRMLGSEYTHLSESLSNGRTVNLVDDNIVIEGWSVRSWEQEPSIIVVELRWKKIYIANASDSKIIVYADNIDPDNYTRLPERMREWINNYNMNHFIRPTIPKNVTLFYSKEQKLAKDRDGIIEDLNNMGAIAQQYYRKPKLKGGGGNTFTGWKIPERIDTTMHGRYSAIVNEQKVVITGIGNVKKDNVFIQHSATVNPSTIQIKKDN
jgi:hypothetical protein